MFELMHSAAVTTVIGVHTSGSKTTKMLQLALLKVRHWSVDSVYHTQEVETQGQISHYRLT
jgi:hypothetical protein